MARPRDTGFEIRARLTRGTISQPLRPTRVVYLYVYEGAGKKHVFDN